MSSRNSLDDKAHFALMGAAAGAVSTFTFALIHALFISDIWFSLVMMLVAGALCGALIAWSYAFLVDSPSLGGWLFYNLLYLLIFFLLTAVSFLIFEPMTTMAAVMIDSSIYGLMIARALPVTAVFTLAASLSMTLIYGRSWKNFAVLLLTCSILILLLGHNLSAMGLVAIPRSGFYLVAEMLGLVLALNIVFVLAFIIIEWKSLFTINHPAKTFVAENL